MSVDVEGRPPPEGAIVNLERFLIMLALIASCFAMWLALQALYEVRAP